MAETGYDSSPKTRGVLIRARRPSQAARRGNESTIAARVSPQESVAGAGVSKRSTIDELVARAFEFGAESAKIIDTDTVVVEKWVKWKCIYGCPMYAKDGHHPPATPDLEEVREVLGEYAKAILLSGRNGRFLSEVACRLEGEAYRSGFYKAFALIALPLGVDTSSSPGGT